VRGQKRTVTRKNTRKDGFMTERLPYRVILAPITGNCVETTKWACGKCQEVFPSHENAKACQCSNQPDLLEKMQYLLYRVDAACKEIEATNYKSGGSAYRHLQKALVVCGIRFNEESHLAIPSYEQMRSIELTLLRNQALREGRDVSHLPLSDA